MSALVADTHAVLWYVLNSPELSSVARQRIELAAQEGNPVYVPAICLVEITYLTEKGRVPKELLTRIMDALRDDRNVFVLAPLNLAVIDALPRVPRDQVRDMPDRIIAATALALDVPLISRDRRIAASMETEW